MWLVETYSVVGDVATVASSRLRDFAADTASVMRSVIREATLTISSA